MPPIRIGFIGLSATGWAASALAPPLFEEPLSNLYTLTAVSTSRAESAQASSDSYAQKTGKPVAAYHGDTSAIAHDPNVDLVAVSVKAPDSYRAILLQAALP